MSKHWLEINDFSDKEINEMFNAICIDVIGKSPAEVKKEYLGVKTTKKDAKVELSHLLEIIEANDLEISFKVTYLKLDEEVEIPAAPKLDVGLKIDPIQEAMKEQNVIVANRNFQEVGVAKISSPVSSDGPSDNPPPTFDPNAIPNFNI
jgi:hypothetical protein